MNDPAEDLYTRIYAIFAADTGDNGLNKQTNSDTTENMAFVRSMFASSDSYYDRNNTNWPRIRVTVNAEDDNAFSVQCFNASVRFDVEIDRDNKGTTRQPQHAVMARMTELYHRQSMGSTSDWEFGTMRFLRQAVAQTTGKVQVNQIFALVAVSAAQGQGVLVTDPQILAAVA